MGGSGKSIAMTRQQALEPREITGNESGLTSYRAPRVRQGPPDRRPGDTEKIMSEMNRREKEKAKKASTRKGGAALSGAIGSPKTNSFGKTVLSGLSSGTGGIGGKAKELGKTTS